MALQHFSHEHPLALVDEVPKDDDGKQQSVCYGCQEPITSSFYSCDKCNYLLHKKCGELPQGVKHPKHPQHPLTLLAQPYYEGSSCDCDVCGIGDWNWFTYHCSECQFDAHVSCTPLEERPNEHKFHDHPLTFTRRKATFFCDACGTEGEDLSYRCTSTSCEFWIHDTCASSPITINRNDHNHHPLKLSYSIPYSKRKFSHSCYICAKIVHPNYWVYYCASCTYFAHLKCGTSEEEPISDGKSEENLDPNLIHFPMPEESMVQLMSQILIEKNLNKRVIVSKEMENWEILCDVCIQLPTSSQHPEHPIDLRRSKYFNFRRCSCCRKLGHQYCFGGEEACTSFELGACCAITCLPTTIKHKAHKHPLLLQSKDPDHYFMCAACGCEVYYGSHYGCDTCNNFHLEYECATLPATVIHEWDRHPISLTYPPFDHPDDYFCEICEEDIHPAHWLYHCSICDYSFHTNCLRPNKDRWSNLKYGGIYKFEHHPHNLTFVRRRKKKSSMCHNCDAQPSWKDDLPVLECKTCSFNLCMVCAMVCARKESTRK